MKVEDFNALVNELNNKTVDRPNKKTDGTLSGHAAGEPFEKLAYSILKEKYPTKIFKQYEYLNDLYMKNPKVISLDNRKALFDSPVALFLLSRGDKATKDWDPFHVFEEKQDDTADILWHDAGYFNIIDVKTRNTDKNAQAPNIISAYKLAQMCAIMIDNDDFDSVGINYVEVNWKEEGDYLRCAGANWKNLFKSDPSTLYINWAAAMQIQFHVCDLDQSFSGTQKDWAKAYLKVFVTSAERRCKVMYDKYVLPFKKYIDEDKDTLF